MTIDLAICVLSLFHKQRRGNRVATELHDDIDIFFAGPAPLTKNVRLNDLVLWVPIEAREGLQGQLTQLVCKHLLAHTRQLGHLVRQLVQPRHHNTHSSASTVSAV